MRLAAAICLLLLLASPARADADAWKPRAELTSVDLRAIEAAMPYLKRRRPGWTHYNISTAETRRTIIVSFTRPEDQSEIRVINPDGSDALPGFVMHRDTTSLHVELDKRTHAKVRIFEGND